MTLALLIVLALVQLLPASPAAAAPPVWRWPLDGRPRIVRHFAPPLERWLAGHRGIDLAAPPATPVLAAGAGTVRYAGRLAGRGVVSVEHPGGLRTTYLPVMPSVRRGQHVSAGDPIGTVEASANHHCDESCLHWGLLRPPRYLDPLLLLGQAHIRLLPFWDPVPEVNVRFPPDAPSGARPETLDVRSGGRPETLDMRGEDTHEGPPMSPAFATPHVTPPPPTAPGPIRPHDTTHPETSGSATLQAVTTTPNSSRESSSPTRTRSPATTAAASQPLITLAQHEQRRTTTTANHQHTPTEAHTATHAITDPVAPTAPTQRPTPTPSPLRAPLRCSRALWSRALWSRALWSRALWSRALWSRALWSRALWSRALWSRALWSRALWPRRTRRARTTRKTRRTRKTRGALRSPTVGEPAAPWPAHPRSFPGIAACSSPHWTTQCRAHHHTTHLRRRVPPPPCGLYGSRTVPPQPPRQAPWARPRSSPASSWSYCCVIANQAAQGNQGRDRHEALIESLNARKRTTPHEGEDDTPRHHPRHLPATHPPRAAGRRDGEAARRQDREAARRRGGEEARRRGGEEARRRGGEEARRRGGEAARRRGGEAARRRGDRRRSHIPMTT
ncbi:peptidoglycan DD-metalloendopeptidase family protein [Nonomuraea sp. NPDC050405]